MVIVGALLVVVIAAAGAGWLIRRRTDEVHSVDRYHQTLNTLEHLQETSSTSAVRVLRPPVVLEAEPQVHRRDLEVAPPELVPEPEPPNEPVPHKMVRLVFSDIDPIDTEVSQPSRSRLAPRDRAIAAMNHRGASLWAPILTVAVVGATVVALIVLGSHAPAKALSNTGRPAASRVHHTASRHASGSRASGSSKSETSSHASDHPAQATPTVYSPASGSTAEATYMLSSTSYTLSITATSGACWVDVTSSNAADSSELTLEPGATKTFTLSGPATVTLGAPEEILATLDNKPVVFPTGFLTPFHFTLQPPGGVSSPSSSNSGNPGATSTGQITTAEPANPLNP